MYELLVVVVVVVVVVGSVMGKALIGVSSTVSRLVFLHERELVVDSR